MFEHEDVLVSLNSNVPLADKLQNIHDLVIERFAFIDRIAVALYDAQTRVLKTFIHVTSGDVPLACYEASLDDAPSLRDILLQRRPRVVQDLQLFHDGAHEHTRRIEAKGYRSSYTLPIYHNGDFIGFLFFNSHQSDCFTAEALPLLDVFGHLISLTIINELVSIRTLIASVQAARHVTEYRDMETGAHITRTAHYARLIALGLAPKYQLDDEFIEQVFLFSPLHDIGKIGVPDAVLRKPGKLSSEEFEIMKTHPRRGGEMIDIMLKDFALSSFAQAQILRNIALYHHEAMDGSGYPMGLKGEAIPLEARISAVADVFDALTSQRPYKEALTNEAAFKILHDWTGTKLDPECVAALVNNQARIAAIQARFRDVPPV